MRLRPHIGIAGFFVSSAVAAAQLTASVVDAHGKPVMDAVVTLTEHAGAANAGNPHPVKAASKVIDQENETFVPYVEIFRPGDSVVFHNADHTRHHAYSFAPARQFEFVLTSGQSSAPLLLEQAGVIAVGCNIHDQMIAYLYVTEAAYVARTGADGRAIIDGLTPGTFDVQVWHPQMRPGQPRPSQRLQIVTDGDVRSLPFALVLLPDPRTPIDRERAKY